MGPTSAAQFGGTAQQVSFAAQTVILEVSRKVVARENVLLTDEVLTGEATEHVGPVMSSLAPSWDGFLPTGSLPEEATRRFGHRLVAVMMGWLHGSLESFAIGSETTWISVYQLYLDFQHQTGELGPVHQKCWKDPESLPDLKLVPKTFKRRCTWFGRVLRAVVKSYGVNLP